MSSFHACSAWMVLARSSGGPDPEKLRRLEIREKYPILRSACTRRLVRVHDELRRAHVPPVHCDERLLRPSCADDPVDKNYPQRHRCFPHLFHDFVIPPQQSFQSVCIPSITLLLRGIYIHIYVNHCRYRRPALSSPYVPNPGLSPLQDLAR